MSEALERIIARHEREERDRQAVLESLPELPDGHSWLILNHELLRAEQDAVGHLFTVGEVRQESAGAGWRLSAVVDGRWEEDTHEYPSRTDAADALAELLHELARRADGARRVAEAAAGADGLDSAQASAVGVLAESDG